MIGDRFEPEDPKRLPGYRGRGRGKGIGLVLGLGLGFGSGSGPSGLYGVTAVLAALLEGGDRGGRGGGGDLHRRGGAALAHG